MFGIIFKMLLNEQARLPGSSQCAQQIFNFDEYFQWHSEAGVQKQKRCRASQHSEKGDKSSKNDHY